MLHLSDVSPDSLDKHVVLLKSFPHRLLAAVENIAYPGICSSPERCILAFLFDLYSSCAHLRVRTLTKQTECSGSQLFKGWAYAIVRINHCPVDNIIFLIDSIVHPLKNKGLQCRGYHWQPLLRTKLVQGFFIWLLLEYHSPGQELCLADYCLLTWTINAKHLEILIKELTSYWKTTWYVKWN